MRSATPAALALNDDLLIHGDNLGVLSLLPDRAFDMAYVDPPFNTGRARRHDSLRVLADEAGERTGFGGRRYRTQLLRSLAYEDSFGDYLGFLAPRLEEIRRVLADHGTLYFHIDYREAHYCKLLLDELFGRECFLNEIIWAYDFGGRPRRRWPAKHDTILVYVKDPARYHFDDAEVEREPYMAPGLVTAEKAQRGKLPTDCYSEDTDILTEDGWVPFPELRAGRRVATVTPDGDLVFAHPTRLHRRYHDGDMLALRSRTVNLLVTPNHHLYVRPKHGDDFQFMPARALTSRASSSYVSFPNSLVWFGEEAGRQFEVPPVSYRNSRCAKPLPPFEMGDWCEFMGWYLAEGCTVQYRDRAEVVIAQVKHPDRVERLGRLLARMPLHAHYNGRGFVICNKQLTAYLRPLGSAHEKRIPRELMGLPPGYLVRLLDGLLLGDGYRRDQIGKHHEIRYTTVSAALAGDVQELFLKLSCTASVTHDDRSPQRWRRRYDVYVRWSRESTIWPGRHVQRVPYRGDVFCATVVPHHTLVVRRDGRPAVSGNCWWHTIVPTNGRERTGYPTQKPEGIVRRMVAASSRPGGWCLDAFAGSGTLGAVARGLGRRFVLIDSNAEAIEIARARMAAHRPIPDRA